MILYVYKTSIKNKNIKKREEQSKQSFKKMKTYPEDSHVLFCYSKEAFFLTFYVLGSRNKQSQTALDRASQAPL